MESVKKTHRPKLIWIFLIGGLVAFILYITVFVNPTIVIDTLSKTNLAIYAGAFIAYTLYTICSSLVWQGLLNSLSVKITKRKAFLYTWTGLFFEATLPQLGWSGEISKTYLLAKEAKVDAGRIGASVVGQKIFTMTITITALSTGLGLLLFRYSLPLATTLLIGVVLALSILTLVVVYYISLKPSTTKTLLNWAIKIARFFRKNWNPQNFSNKTEAMLCRFHIGMIQLKANPRALVPLIAFAVVGFVFEVSVLFISFLALGQTVSADVVLIVFTLTGTLQSVGVAFFIPDLFMTLSFTAFDVLPGVAVAATLLSRVVNLWFRLGVSYGALQWAGIRIIKQNQAN